MRTKTIITAAMGFAAICAVGCSGRTSSSDNNGETTPAIVVAEFDSDSAFAAVKAQTDMGPRNPGSHGHERCAVWLVSELKRRGANTVIVDRAVVAGPDGQPMPITNITGRFNPEAGSRVLLAAHWDTRPTADAESDPSLHTRPIDGANDGASGVGVLLEIARQLGIKRAAVGVDLLMVDAEDSGISGGGEETTETWCIGTQHWASTHPYNATNIPRYAIVLDMVGGRGARFHREAVSVANAPGIVDKVWSMARAIGHGDRFVNELGGPLVDDHVFIQRAGIPAIDIVECRNASTGSFNPTWHTLADNISNIDPTSLKAAGQTVLTVVYNEKP